MLDIGAIITEQLTTTGDRKDHGGLSVSDVANGCARAKWWELHHGLRKEFDGTTRKKFEYGYALEKVVQTALEAKGYYIVPSCVVVFHPEKQFPMNVDIIPSNMYDENPGEYAKPTDIVGHPDIVVNPAPGKTAIPGTLLIEVKSTMLFRNGNQPPQHPDIDTLRVKNGNYVIQGVAYAKGVGAKSFAVYVSDRGTGIDKTYWFDTEREFPLFEARKAELLPALNPDAEPEPTLPAWTRSAKGTSYLCRGCPVKSCANNLT